MADSITLEKIVYRGKNVALELSSLTYPLIISEELVHKFRLVEGIVLTPSQVERLIAEAEQLRCEETATRLLARRQHSVGELKIKLRQRRFTAETIDLILEKYINTGLLDDTRYAYELAEYMVEQRPCGKSYLTAFLQRKFIDRATAEQVVRMVFADRDETEIAVAALRKRWREFAQFELEAIQRKSYTYLTSRGFTFAVAKEALTRLRNEKNEVTRD